MTIEARVEKTYSPDEERPLGGYTALMAAYATGFAGLQLLRRRHRRRALHIGDLALVAVATQKLSRILTKDSIASPLRAPFVRYDRPTGAGEVSEQVIVPGPAHAVGELATCPLCLDVWVATGLLAGMELAPEVTRFGAAVLAVASVSNALHLVWDKSKNLV